MIISMVLSATYRTTLGRRDLSRSEIRERRQARGQLHGISRSLCHGEVGRTSVSGGQGRAEELETIT